MEDQDLYTAFEELDREGRRRLLRYLAGEASLEEVEAIQQWLAEDPRRAEVVHRMRRLRTISSVAPDLWNVDDAFQRLTTRLGIADPAAGGASRTEMTPTQTETAAPVAPAPSTGSKVLPFRARPAATARPQRGWAQRLGTLTRIAATIALIAGGALLWQQRETLFAPTDGPMQELAAGVGQRVRLTLADGSEVVLGPNSRLYFPERFGRTRNVRLEGEAVFDVVSDSARPFRVHAGNATTRVLGTRFGVRAFASDEYVEVIVSEGLVEVTAAEETTSSKEVAVGDRAEPAAEAPRAVRLAAGQAVRVAGDGTLGELRAVDAKRHLSWTEGNLYFEQTPLAEVAQILARRHGIKVELADRDVASMRLTAEFLEPVQSSEIVRFIALSLGIEYRRTADGYLLIQPTH